MEQTVSIPAYVLPLPFLLFFLVYLLQRRQPVVAVPSAVSYSTLLSKVAEDVQRRLPPFASDADVRNLVAKLVPDMIAAHVNGHLDKRLGEAVAGAVGDALDLARQQLANHVTATLAANLASLQPAAGTAGQPDSARSGAPDQAASPAPVPPGGLLRVMAWLFFALGIGLAGDGVVLGHLRLVGQVAEWTGAGAAVVASAACFLASFGCWERQLGHVRRAAPAAAEPAAWR